MRSRPTRFLRGVTQVRKEPGLPPEQVLELGPKGGHGGEAVPGCLLETTLEHGREQRVQARHERILVELAHRIAIARRPPSAVVGTGASKGGFPPAAIWKSSTHRL